VRQIRELGFAHQWNMSTPGGSPNYWRLPPKNASKSVHLYGTTTGIPPRERLAIYKALNELEIGLTDALKIESQAAAEAHEFLKQGPITSQKVSRLTATHTSVIIESEA
jgi:hypothetical protein